MKKIVLALFSALLFSASLNAASLYILYDPACMDRLEYVALSGDDKSEYIVYHVNTSPGVKVVLEVGAESTTSQDFPPAQVIKCNNAVFDEKLVNAINSNIERVFMVVKKGNNRYFISPITFAARYLRSDNYILYDSPKYRFQFDTQLGTIGENIAYKNPKTEVYFEGMLENECSGTLLFQQKAEFAGNPHTNIELIPEVGIVEERSGINAADAMRNVIRLEKVNGKKLDRYLRKICQGIDEPEEPTGDVQAEQPANARVETLAPRGETPTLKTIPPTPPAAKVHQVKKGETLYRISKQYGVTVAQLQTWNNKGNSNTIFAGEQLQVAPSAAARPAAPATPAEGQVRTLGGPLGYDNSSAPSPAPASTTRISEKGTGQNYHIVKPGETVASIAMRYGYTEPRFRAFNNLGANEVAKIGQPLKTSDCDCPQSTATTSNQQIQNTARQQYSSGNYATSNNSASTQPGSYSTGARTTLPQIGGSTTAQRGTQQPSGTEEAFYDDNLNTSRNYAEEYNYRNTPLFLDQPSAPPPSAAPPAYRTPTTTTANPPAGNRSQGREYSPQGDFYSITGSRIDSGSPNTGGSGLISGSFSRRSPASSGMVQDYGNDSSSRSGGSRTVYVVKEGDTLYRIARIHGVTVERLRAINNLGANEVIIPYQKIYLN